MATTVGESRDHTTAADQAWDGLRDRISIQLRPIGTPVALGFFGLAAATFVLSSLQLEWVPVTDGRTVAFALMGFAFLALRARPQSSASSPVTARPRRRWRHWD